MPADDDAPADVQPKAGALANWLGGEERLEDPLPDVGGYARPGVTDIDHKLVAVQRGPDCQRARPLHRRHRVVDQVGPHLVELAREAGNRRNVMTVVSDDGDPVADLAAEH